MKTTKWSKSTRNKFEKWERWRPRVGGICFGSVSKTFSGNFLRAVYSSRVQVKFKGKHSNKQTKKFLSYSLVWKTLLVLKADERCHDFSAYRSQFLQTLLLIFPWKSTQVKIHTKMASFCLVFSAKNPVKSDKLALIELVRSWMRCFLIFIFQWYLLRIG